MKQKYVIEVTELDSRPDDWTSKDKWPGEGLYICKGDTSMYSVGEYSVDYIGTARPLLVRPVTDEQLNHPITETLLLKAIAAASRAEVLK
jgi:hypothetical protein